jgi:FtsP/CotA-like multicopper oxidase with cupredoxin domain
LLALPAARTNERAFSLDIVYVDSAIYNPATGRHDAVHLRSYQGTGVNPAAPFVAPTIEMAPGESVRISLRNRLPPDPGCNDGKSPVNSPHCFNGTNLHSHGLWVSPTGNSDNVLLSINPGVSFQYEYNLPPDHPSGTFWYHTHRHGSTALQVSSGMAGALIVRGNRKPTAAANGDIDTLLQDAAGIPIPERIVLFQQIQYACTGPDHKLKYIDNDVAKGIDWRCNAGETGVVESYEQFGPGSWDASGRYTSINGTVLPTFATKSGQLERWRLVHAGVRDTISLQFRKVASSLPRPRGVLKAAERDAFVAETCTGPAIDYHVIASDGLTMSQAQRRNTLTLQPAYRNDLLIAFPGPGRYCIVDAAAPAAGNVGGTASGRQLLGFVEVAPGAAVGNSDEFLTTYLVKAAQVTMNPDVRAEIIAGLKNGLKLAKFTPHPDIADSELTGTQNLVFTIDFDDPNGPKFQVGTKNSDLAAYLPERIDRVLRLGDVETWILESHFVSHPFHIHVNPFQIVKIIDPNGKDVSAADAVDDAGGTADPQYPGLKGVWKDTLWVKSLIPGVDYPKGVYQLHVRTRYQRYIGEFVLHCHILDHEDQGMMQNISVRIPDGAGGTSHSHH